MKIFITLTAIIFSANILADAQNALDSLVDNEIKRLQEKLFDKNDIPFTCSQWVQKDLCISYLKRALKEITVDLAQFDLKGIRIDDLDENQVFMNKKVLLSSGSNFNEQINKMYSQFHKVNELRNLSRSYARQFNYSISCSSKLNTHECEMGLFNFLKTKPANYSKDRVKRVIISKSDGDLSIKGNIFISHENQNANKYMEQKVNQMTPVDYAINFSELTVQEVL